MDTVTQVTAIVGAVTGILGTGLGFWSLYRQFDADRLKLRVSFSMALSSEFREPFFTVSVVNRSKFPVTIRAIELLVDNDRSRLVARGTTTSQGGRLPVRLEPRTDMTLYFPPEFHRNPQTHEATQVLVRTACGEEVRSTATDVGRRLKRAAELERETA